jgi:hypothetical protein
MRGLPNEFCELRAYPFSGRRSRCSSTLCRTTFRPASTPATTWDRPPLRGRPSQGMAPSTRLPLRTGLLEGWRERAGERASDRARGASERASEGRERAREGRRERGELTITLSRSLDCILALTMSYCNHQCQQGPQAEPSVATHRKRSCRRNSPMLTGEEICEELRTNGRTDFKKNLAAYR